jgi:DNA (cytosine-5)-methyltransferase 1
LSAREEIATGSTYVCSFTLFREDMQHKSHYTVAAEYYISRPEEIRESADTFLEGEDELSSESEADDELLIQHRRRDDNPPKEKPIRIITNFTIFDSRHRNEYVVLSKIEEEDGVDRKFEVTGSVVPYYVNEEDLVGGDNDDGRNADDEVQPVLMRIGPVLRFTIDWTKDEE